MPGPILASSRCCTQARELSSNARLCNGFQKAQCAGATARSHCPARPWLQGGEMCRRGSSRAMPGPTLASGRRSTQARQLGPMPGPAIVSIRRSAQARHLAGYARPYFGFERDSAQAQQPVGTARALSCFTSRSVQANISRAMPGRLWLQKVQCAGATVCGQCPIPTLASKRRSAQARQLSGNSRPCNGFSKA